jgi:hypothetical protein
MTTTPFEFNPADSPAPSRVPAGSTWPARGVVEPSNSDALAALHQARSSIRKTAGKTMHSPMNSLRTPMFRSTLGAGCLVVASLLGMSGTAVASVVVSESFTYADGALAGANGGVGLAGAWSAGATVAGGVATLAGSTGSTRSLSSAIVPTAGQSLYLGVNIGADPSAAAFDYAGLAFLSGGVDRLFFGMPFQRDNYGFGVNGYTTQESGVTASAIPSYLVAQILFNSASSITVNLFVDPVGALGTANATYTGTMMTGSWDAIRIVNNNSPSSFDNIVIGTTLADVYSTGDLKVPEPSSFALAGLALLALSGARRRRSAS